MSQHSSWLTIHNTYTCGLASREGFILSFSLLLKGLANLLVMCKCCLNKMFFTMFQSNNFVGSSPTWGNIFSLQFVLLRSLAIFLIQINKVMNISYNQTYFNEYFAMFGHNNSFLGGLTAVKCMFFTRIAWQTVNFIFSEYDENEIITRKTEFTSNLLPPFILSLGMNGIIKGQ